MLGSRNNKRRRYQSRIRRKEGPGRVLGEEGTTKLQQRILQQIL